MVPMNDRNTGILVVYTYLFIISMC